MFSSRMKQNKKAKISAVFCFAGKKKLLFYIYAVIVKQNFYKRATIQQLTYDGNPLGWRAHGRNARGQADHVELAHMVVN